MNAIIRAVEAAGGQKALALSISVSPQQVNQWVKGVRPVPADKCLQIEGAIDAAVTRYELRPDVFGIAPTVDSARVA